MGLAYRINLSHDIWQSIRTSPLQDWSIFLIKNTLGELFMADTKKITVSTPVPPLGEGKGHRNLIGFDEHGIPTVLVEGEKAPRRHVDENGNTYFDLAEAEFTEDYNKAVATYRKTFPTKQDVIDSTADPAVRDMLLHLEQLGAETGFDRFDAQKPQCSFGQAGVCCRICTMGPCKITAKAPRGVCGADADLIVARNLLRMAAAGVSQHGMHAREVILSLKWAAEGKLNIPIVGEYKIKQTAEAFGIKTKGRQLKFIASDLANVLLEDLSRTEPGEYKTIKALAPPERQKVWESLDLIPISAYHEVFESYHKTGVGTDGDWKSILQQFLRCGLAFTFSTVVASNIATDSLFGVGDRVTAKTNIGALKPGCVNIALHGHLPTLVSEIVKLGQSERYENLAKEAGAEGIQFYGICCSGLSALYRYENIIPLSNALTAELVMGTGALDLWVADVQDVFPGIMNVAKCTRTKVITTSDSARLPGAEHIAYDHRHTNIGETRELAETILSKAIESFVSRRDVPVFIPPYEVEAEVGFSVEYIHKRFGGFAPLAEALKSGQILGVVNMVGCSNPKVLYERATVDVADVLLKSNVLILTNGCASFPLMKLGYCNVQDGQRKAGKSLREFLGNDLPPVWHVGECIDNCRSSNIFGGIAGEVGQFLYEMPFAFTSPEWGNEKGVDAALGFRMMGITSYHCVEAPIFGSANVINFLKNETKDLLGSSMVVNTDPAALGKQIVEDLIEKRRALGWAVPEEVLE